MDRRRHLRSLREHEARTALRYFPEKGRVLEIGAGSGWQSKLFDELGYDVSAIDLATSHYLEDAVFPVKTYDGYRIPFADGCFDLVFSSNALEHIPHIEEFQSEIRRVLVPGGRAVHILPSGSWRFWTTVTYYATLPARVLRRVLRRPLVRRSRVVGDANFWKRVSEETDVEEMDMGEFAEFVSGDEAATEPRPGFVDELRSRLQVLQKITPAPHGEFGNFATEIYYFSRLRWRRLFRGTGFRVVDCCRNGLFYTGHSLLGARLSLDTRRRLSRLLGSSCQVYVLERLTLRAGGRGSTP